MWKKPQHKNSSVESKQLEMATPDMDVIKEIPGYKVILKAVLKAQIQQLVSIISPSPPSVECLV